MHLARFGGQLVASLDCQRRSLLAMTAMLAATWAIGLSPSAPSWAQGLPLEPIRREESRVDGPGVGPVAGELPELRTALLGGISVVSELPFDRQTKVTGPAAEAVLGGEAAFRNTTDSGNLVSKSLSVRGVSSQQRTPITTDTRVRGERVGQLLATGSYWTPVRMDLDTMLSKIDSRLIDSLIVIKGPYSPRYGPGFSFIDIDLLGTPRFDEGFESHGTSSVDYVTNGAQWYGRQTFYGGGVDWGYRASYGHRTGSDYRDGSGYALPSSYNSRDVNLALGKDFGGARRVEFNYLRLDQTGVEYPGLVFDTRYLLTDGYEVKYYDQSPWLSDQHVSEFWYNRTHFEGDTLGIGKNRQIPNLRQILFSPSGVDGFAITDGFGSSLGYRTESTFGDPGYSHVSVGTDMILLRQRIDDIEPLLPANDNNFPLPQSESFDFGFYLERVAPVGEFVRVNTGARVDVVRTLSSGDADGYAPLFTPEELERNFTTWMVYSSCDVDLTDHWIGRAGMGYGQRPPTLTELYVDASFIGSLQSGLTYLEGEENLKPETLRQIDVGLAANYNRFTGGAGWYYAWIDDYITYDALTPGAGYDGLPSGAGFVNTNLATLMGVEAYGQYRALNHLSIFGTLSYVEGTDRTRSQTSYLSDPVLDRSLEPGVPTEPLPGIPPLDSRVGVSYHDVAKSVWALEFSMRAVARQNRIAATLDEIETPGFVTLDLRGYRRLGAGWLLTAGVENLTDRFYREHLDYRTGLGVFRPGIGCYTGLEANY
ncbi:MAG: TonB-dependent receptor [Planctomycetales bacterium]|nr:TonB-dependent receptor [Planctomycetales bacterium]